MKSTVEYECKYIEQGVSFVTNSRYAQRIFKGYLHHIVSVTNILFRGKKSLYIYMYMISFFVHVSRYVNMVLIIKFGTCGYLNFH